jgi:hypothetical protein
VPTSTGTVELVRDRDRNGVTLVVNGAPSSYHELDDPGFLAFEYMQQMAAFVEGLPPGPLRVVHLGAAGCTFARWVEHARPGSTQLAVDLDHELLALVREWFDLPRSPRLRLRTGDARRELSTLRAGWADVVVRDAFAPDVTPPHLTTVEFDREVWRVLAPGGIYLANCADRAPLPVARSESRTWAESGAHDVVLSAEPALLRGRRYGNLVLAVRRPDPDALADTSPHIVPLADDAALARRLRTLPVPAHVLGGDELASFAASGLVRRDPPNDPSWTPSADPARAPARRGPHDDAAPSVVEDAASGRESGRSVRAGGPSRPGGPSDPA